MSLRQSLNIQSNPAKNSYYPSSQVFESPSKSAQNIISQQRKQYEQQSNLFASGMVLQQLSQNQFHVSGNSSFKYFSEPKLKNEQTQAELERQRRYCYSDEVSYNTDKYSNNQNICNNKNDTFPGEENEKIIAQTQLKHENKENTQDKYILGFKLSKNCIKNMHNQSKSLSSRKNSTHKIEKENDSNNQSYSVDRNSRTFLNIAQQQVNYNNNTMNNSPDRSSDIRQDSCSKNYDKASIEKNYNDTPRNSSSFFDNSIMDSATNELLNRNDSSFQSSYYKKKRGIVKNCMILVIIIVAGYYTLQKYDVTQKYLQDKPIQTQSNIEELQSKNQYFNQIIATNERNTNTSLENDKKEQVFTSSSKGYKQYERQLEDQESDIEGLLSIQENQSHSQKILFLAERYYMRFLLQIQVISKLSYFKIQVIISLGFELSQLFLF